MTNNRTELPEAGGTALRLLDKLLAERPMKVGHDFSEATRYLAVLRDELICRRRSNSSNQDHDQLVRINTVLTIVVGAHFPLAAVPWSQIEQARALLSVALNG